MGIWKGEMNPVVSIVTPSYNMGRFLEETIESVLCQNYPHVEYIVMDGGSTDGSLEILRKYKHRLRYESQPDRGQADAINRGFQMSRGSIFAFLNADDTYLPDAVSTAVRHMTENAGAGVVYGEGYHVAEGGQVIGRYPVEPFAAERLRSRCCICQPASFMRRDVFESVGMLNPEFHLALDYDLWIRISKRYPMLKINEYLATSRIHRENKTVSQLKEVFQEVFKVQTKEYGYVPFNWVYGYCSHLLDGRSKVFEVARPSISNVGLTLLMGSYYNKTRFIHFWRDAAEVMSSWFKNLSKAH